MNQKTWKIWYVPLLYDLGEDLRLVLISVTEGADKPLKYPTIFNSAELAVITKMDLAAAVEFDEKLLFETSKQSGQERSFGIISKNERWDERVFRVPRAPKEFCSRTPFASLK
ncbi:MAG: hypothetical protein M3P45_01560 [Acidobacteriota bacterium]|nr:hypothetical protein [Acidobacteriota bacterium]